MKRTLLISLAALTAALGILAATLVTPAQATSSTTPNDLPGMGYSVSVQCIDVYCSIRDWQVTGYGFHVDLGHDDSPNFQSSLDSFLLLSYPPLQTTSTTTTVQTTTTTPTTTTDPVTTTTTPTTTTNPITTTTVQTTTTQPQQPPTTTTATTTTDPTPNAATTAALPIVITTTPLTKTNALVVTTSSTPTPKTSRIAVVVTGAIASRGLASALSTQLGFKLTLTPATRCTLAGKHIACIDLSTHVKKARIVTVTGKRSGNLFLATLVAAQ